MKCEGEYYNRRIDATYRAALKGFSHTQLKRQRGFKGTTLGPAGPVHKLAVCQDCG
jgi:hypothetical protein